MHLHFELKRIPRLLLACLIILPLCPQSSKAGSIKTPVHFDIHIALTPQNTQTLSALGQLWVFLKYHHPDVAAGQYDWDAELMKELPNILAAKDKAGLQKELEHWVDQFPKPDICSFCTPVPEGPNVKLKPDYGDLFTPGFLSPSLAAKLRYLIKNGNIHSNYYAEGLVLQRILANSTNEKNYPSSPYPAEGLRLLAVYRYWGLVQYFFPHRHLIGEDWKNVLTEFIPVFLGAKDEGEYLLACRRLITRINDSHAWIFKDNKMYAKDMGIYSTTFSVKFIENKLVVDSVCRGFGGNIAVGDIITHIDGKPVEENVKRMIPIVSASNDAARMRDIASFILRGQTDTVALTVLRGMESRKFLMSRYKPWTAKLIWKYLDNFPKKTAYKTIGSDIGYVYAAKYKNRQLPAIKKAFNNTKGIIVDMRCYPAEYLPDHLGGYLKEGISPFVITTVADTDKPGFFVFAKPRSNGTGPKDQAAKDCYKGKVIILVNEMTQSTPEFATMAFQSGRNVTTLGSTTAGADGNIAKFPLPGGLETSFTGGGVYYPDKAETQRVGLKVDITVKPTLKGFQNGRDELLEKAIDIIHNSK